MPARGELSTDAAELSDEELLRRLHSGTLTPLASDVTRAEPEAGGMDVARIPVQPEAPASLHVGAAARRP